MGRLLLSRESLSFPVARVRIAPRQYPSQFFSRVRTGGSAAKRLRLLSRADLRVIVRFGATVEVRESVSCFNLFRQNLPVNLRAAELSELLRQRTITLALVA